jgi:LmbE family N-acetylglucosaminyl deacetylase
MPTDRAASVLFLFAHPDDEFFCLPVIEREQKHGRRAVCIYLTDGGYNGQSVERRKAETLSVLGAYGVDVSDAHFVGADAGIPDGELHKYMHLAYASAKAMCDHLSLERLIFPAWEGGHQDHDTCHAIGIMLCRALGIPNAPKQFPLYNGYRCSHLFKVMYPLPCNGPVEPILVTPKNIVRYLSTVRRYPSQWKTWLGLLPFATIQALRTRKYVLQTVDADRIKERPHPGPLLYERRTPVRHEDVTASINTMLQSFWSETI